MAIEVATAEDLYNVRNDLTADYVQVADIDLSGYSNWEPIGGGLEGWNAYFAGTYDGQNYKIKNLTCEYPNEDMIGLFGYADSWEVDHDVLIKNIKLIDSHIKGASTVGSLVGYAYEIDIKNCKSLNTLLEVEDQQGGGLIGNFESYIDNVVEDSYVEGQLVRYGGSGMYDIGGFVGWSWSNAFFRRCGAELDIDLSPSSGQLGGQYVGGFIGGQGDQVTIEQCYHIGSITTGGDYFTELGGFIGYNYSSATINNCFHIGNIDAEEKVGGFAGYNEGTIKKTYTVGQINANQNYDPYCFSSTGTISLSYYDQDVNPNITSYATGLTTKEMRDKTSYDNWDFNNIWNINSNYNDGYPFFRWEDVQLENPYLIHFIEEPKTNIEPPSANSVTVKSPTAKYTAEPPNLSADEKIERIIEIDEGDQAVCKTVAQKLLKRWNRELKSVEGAIRINQDLDFEQEMRVEIDEGMVDQDMPIQDMKHDVINQSTHLTLGDIILGDNELLARILEDL